MLLGFPSGKFQQRVEAYLLVLPAHRLEVRWKDCWKSYLHRKFVILGNKVHISKALVHMKFYKLEFLHTAWFSWATQAPFSQSTWRNRTLYMCMCCFSICPDVTSQCLKQQFQWAHRHIYSAKSVNNALRIYDHPPPCPHTQNCHL